MPSEHRQFRKDLMHIKEALMKHLKHLAASVAMAALLTAAYSTAALAEPTEQTASCTEHTYTVENGSQCTSCDHTYTAEVHPISGTLYTTKADAPVHESGSYGSAVLRSVNNNAGLAVKNYFSNALGETWYELADGGFVCGAYMTPKQPPVYTLTFDANGGEGTPASAASSSEWTIPADTVPSRERYTFLGYATTAGATEAQYKPGARINNPTADLTLYAVWAEGGVSSATRARLAATEGFKQVKSTSGNGLCTSCATALMMKRRQIVDGQAPTFDFYDVRMSFGLSRSAATELRDVGANWDQACGFSNYYSGDGRTTFYTTGVSKSQLGHDFASRKASVISLLDQHPEGIVMYCRTSEGVHAICLTSYDANTDTFYGCDSVDVRDAASPAGRCPEPLSSTYLYRKCGGSVEGVFRNLVENSSAGCVWYVNKAVYP